MSVPNRTSGTMHAIVVHVRGDKFVLDRAMLESDAPNVFTATTAPPTVFQRSPATFAVILDHLCGYALPDPLPVPRDRLLADARYYGFTRLAAQLVAQASLPAVGWEDKGFNGGPVVELNDVIKGTLPGGVSIAAPANGWSFTPKRGIGALALSNKDRWLPSLIRATNLPVYFSLSLIDAPETPGGFRYSIRFCLGLTPEQAQALRARYPDARAAARPFQFNEFQGHYSSWFAAPQPHFPNDGIAMKINGVPGSDHMLRAWARSVSMRPYGEDLDPIPLVDEGARRFIAQLFPQSPSRSFALPTDKEQWHYWRQSRVVWADEVLFCLADTALSPSLVAVRGRTAMRLALGDAWGEDQVPAMLPPPVVCEMMHLACSPPAAGAATNGSHAATADSGAVSMNIG
ncbi:hypothetical protein AURDEDRAFT_138634 [Auricularia subglabra TFB-10046 SS5]|uniref:BTB domain-containing protein n=1 Tax=Auricularia subglabra (strain TFB-10046 / SS5) TaxID=717982 RepID=J0D2N6_AURST|nr:hypothetical protein AURDEDRAFT_138634 [Auricularia subglabra TFB-10046 SS5]